MASIDDPSSDRVWLADWRRRVAALYVDVRALAASDPVAAWDRWREGREQLFREHPQSPLPPAARTAFRAVHFEEILATEEEHAEDLRTLIEALRPGERRALAENGKG